MHLDPKELPEWLQREADQVVSENRWRRLAQYAAVITVFWTVALGAWLAVLAVTK